MRIGAIILAAGEGRRIGGPKALLPLRQGSFASEALARFDRAGVAARVIVLGAAAERVAAEAGLPAGIRVVVNELWREGMLTSVWTGLDVAEAAGVDAVLLHPVDNPVVGGETIDAVIAALAAGATIAVPTHGGKRGHPAGFSRLAWPALRTAPLDGGARRVLAAHPDWVVHVPAGPDCLVDIDTREDLRATRETS